MISRLWVALQNPVVGLAKMVPLKMVVETSPLPESKKVGLGGG